MHLPNLLLRLRQTRSQGCPGTTSNWWIWTEHSRTVHCHSPAHHQRCLGTSNGWVGFRDTQISMLLGITQKRNVRSKFWWFTRSCNSHYVSHFAAFFIVVGSKTSIAESCNELYSQKNPKVPVTVLVQFKLYLVMGGTTVSQPTEAGTSCGT